jgi:hypothetical protein
MTWQTYVRQKRKNESGPVALINLGKKLNVKFGYRQYIKRFRELCSCNGPSGTEQSDFNFAIDKIFSWMGKVTQHIAPDVHGLRDAVRKNEGVVLVFDSHVRSRHYVVVTAIQNISALVTMVNYSTTRTKENVDLRAIEQILNTQNCTMWTVKSAL